MDAENQPLIDINQADEKTLTQLRGVGMRLAKRIVAARPFESVDDLTRVRGISARDVERLHPFVTVAALPVEAKEEGEGPLEAVPEEPEIPEGEAAPEVEVTPEDETTDEVWPETLVPLPEIEAEAAEIPDEAETLPEPVDEALEVGGDTGPDADLAPQELGPTDEETPEAAEELLATEAQAAPPGRQPNYITRGRAFGLFLFTFIFSIILAVAITLGIISSLNRGGLTFASPGQITILRNQVDGLTTQTEMLTEDLDGLRTRMDNLEALSGRVNEVEANMEGLQAETLALQTEIETAQSEFDELTSQMDEINQQIETITVQNSRFESFLEGLSELMMGLFPDE